ncbi:hypothetical protein ANRL3_02760 [Anaerolineae bacterium]|nr:hypothetical protein ANRL3_02760 [Anaerolineae bacterium]
MWREIRLLVRPLTVMHAVCRELQAVYLYAGATLFRRVFLKEP